MSATLQCTVSDGDLPLRLRWLINGRVVSRALHDVSVAEINHRLILLTIESMTGNHAGNYTCEARNRAATAQYTTRLIVNGLWITHLSLLQLQKFSQFCCIAVLTVAVVPWFALFIVFYAGGNMVIVADFFSED